MRIFIGALSHLLGDDNLFVNAESSAVLANGSIYKEGGFPKFVGVQTQLAHNDTVAAVKSRLQSEAIASFPTSESTTVLFLDDRGIL